MAIHIRTDEARGPDGHRPYSAALYMRLSRDDEEREESNSIASQRMILRKFAEESGVDVYDEYIDDGWSGTNFDRPGFQRMIGEIEDGKVNCVITKDLSRLGRNYVQVGEYTEFYFPRHGVRYIAINDGVDSLRGESEIAPFKNIINEWYARDTSKKVKSAFRARYESGMRLSARPPFGYGKSPDQKGLIVPDEETAWIVRKIFAMAYEGMGASKITRALCREGIPTPGQVSRRRGELAYARSGAIERAEGAALWQISTVSRILKDPTYIGDTVHYRQGRASFKDKRRISNPPSEWLYVEGTHEPIVERRVFEAVQRQAASRHRSTKSGWVSALTGLVRCADCGGSMCYTPGGSKIPEKGYYACKKGSMYGANVCGRHLIRYDVLYAYVLSRIRHWMEQMRTHEAELLEEFRRRAADASAAGQTREHAEREACERRLSEIDGRFTRLYEDRLGGLITEENFEMLLARYQGEQAQLHARLASMREGMGGEPSDAGQWLEKVRRYTQPEALTVPMLNALVEKIVVHACETPRARKNRVQKVEIYYRFAMGAEGASMGLDGIYPGGHEHHRGERV